MQAYAFYLILFQNCFHVKKSRFRKGIVFQTVTILHYGIKLSISSVSFTSTKLSGT